MPRPSRLTALDRMDAVVLDTETTGLDAAAARTVQISAVRIAGGRVLADQTFDALVNPGSPIPPASTTVHGSARRWSEGASQPGIARAHRIAPAASFGQNGTCAASDPSSPPACWAA